jgi:hypothetical protein
MIQHKKFRWVPFYLLVPLAGALLLLDEEASMGDTVRVVILGVIVLIVCALALLWIERNPRLVESEGVDSLRGHYLLQGMIPHWEQTREDLVPVDDDDQFTPVRHSSSASEEIAPCERS